MESVPDKPAEVLNLKDKRAARYRSQVLDELAELEAAADEAANGPHRSPVGWLKVKKRDLAADLEQAAQIDAYQGQYPADEAAELAGRIWADRSGGARPQSRPTVEDQSEEGYAARVLRHSTYAPELVEVLDLGGAQ